MKRKQRKQERKQRQNQSKVSKEIDTLAMQLATAISKMPRQKHNQETFIENGRKGCFVTGGSNPKAYCDECYCKEWCGKKEIYWIIIDGSLVEWRDYVSQSVRSSVYGKDRMVQRKWRNDCRLNAERQWQSV